jgi:hypothetical protein
MHCFWLTKLNPRLFIWLVRRADRFFDAERFNSLAFSQTQSPLVCHEINVYSRGRLVVGLGATSGYLKAAFTN